MIIDYLKDWFTGTFLSLKIKHKLLITYFILIMIPLCIFGLVAFKRSSTVIQKQTKDSADKVLEQTEAFLSFKLNNVLRVSNLLINSTEIMGILQKDMSEYQIPEQIDDANLLSLSLKGMEYNNELFRIRLHVRDKLLYSNENINLFSLNTIENNNFYKNVKSSNGQIIWSNIYTNSYLGEKDKRVLTASRLIINTKNFNNITGILSVDILESELIDIIKKADYTGKGFVYLVNATGNIICNTESSELTKNALDNDKLKELAKTDSLWQDTNINGLDVVIGSKIVDPTGWKLVTIVPINDMMTANSKLGVQIVILLIFIGFLANSAAVYITYSNTKRLNKMVKTMRCIQNGNLNAKVTVDSGDEIGEVQQNFNYMVDKVNQLMNERDVISNSARKSELNALQAQINPHFLYNTMDMIYWLAKKNNSQSICSAVTCLAKFYKLSLSKGMEFITIKDEIEHVCLYIDIQNMRYENRIQLEVDVDSNILQYFTLKLILQPLVENSILHGIMQKESKKGTLRITGGVIKNTIEIVIKDDGIGIPKERLSRLFTSTDLSGLNGYGVKNINERIKIHYGKEFGLFYDSEVGKGTEVTVKIPVTESYQRGCNNFCV